MSSSVADRPTWRSIRLSDAANFTFFHRYTSFDTEAAAVRLEKKMKWQERKDRAQMEAADAEAKEQGSDEQDGESQAWSVPLVRVQNHGVRSIGASKIHIQ
jgi:hypothetical protein